ncbi:MAG: ABC transporter substrate-binding protein [Clostridia bacterium]|nr:ABC transporter substrate-binding protein [Clostridia bacterium]
MKRILAILLMAAMILSAAFAEEIPGDEAPQAAIPEPVHYDYDELVVGNVMPMYGAFSLRNWGNSTSDIDVRKLIHGYNLAEWNPAVGGFRMDPTVVTLGSVVTRDEDGNHIYNLTLYDDLYYSDGTQITAWDYAFSWLLRTSPLINEIGGTAEQADFLVGWDEYQAGEVPYLAGIQVTGEYSLRIAVSAAYLPYFYEVGLLDCYPCPIQAIAPDCEVADDGEGVYIRNRENPEGEALFTADLLKKTLLNETDGYLSHPSVVSGAYRLVSFDGTEARFELNPYYKGNADGLKPVIPRIVFRTANADTMVDELLQGSYGLLNKVTRADVVQDALTRAIGGGNYIQEAYPRPGLSFVTFNGKRPATADPAVRQAMALCMDKENLKNDYVGGYGIKADGFYGLGQWMFLMVSGSIAQDPDPDMTEAEIEQMRQEWETVTLDGLETYEYDTARAQDILDKAGWTLNRAGEAYDSSRDDVRCREIDGELVPLELKLVYPETTDIGDALMNRFAAPLKEAGIALKLEASDAVLAMYYGQEEADYDLLYLATNFDVAFDPSPIFMEGGAVNVNGIKDEELVKLAQDMRQTEPGDLISYCRKWITFLEKFAETEPIIPVYSNVYYDFHPEVLRGYKINQFTAWSEAIVGSYFSDVPEVPAEEAELMD